MLGQSIRSPRSFIVHCAAGLIAAAGLAGCGGAAEEGADPPAAQHVRNELVTHEDIAELAPGELFTIDLRAADLVYHVDYARAPIDYARIEVVEGDGTRKSMEVAIAEVRDFDYGDDPPVDLLAAPDQRFRVAGDPADFGALDDAQLRELKETGYVYAPESGEPAAQPQNEDGCVYAVCEVCPNGWENGCYYVQHVWCGPS